MFIFFLNGNGDLSRLGLNNRFKEYKIRNMVLKFNPMKNFLLFLFLALWIDVHAQVAISNDGSLPDNSAMLDVKSTDKGILIPRMTMAQRNAIASPATGLMIYQTDNSPGFYYNSGTSGSPAWLIAGTGSGWGLTGNSGTNPAANFIGTSDNQDVIFKRNNIIAGYIGPNNIAFGVNSLAFLSTGIDNTASGRAALFYNTTGSYNMANGNEALISNISGNYNTAAGFQALYGNTTGSWNTAEGSGALFDNTTGNFNTATGYLALNYNSTGSQNSAFGNHALTYNVAGNQATAIGCNAMYYSNNQTGAFTNYNVAVGYEALMGSNNPVNNTGNFNTATGYQTLWSNSSGYSNTATGYPALNNNTTGWQNSSYGANSLVNNTTGSYNTAIGYNTGPNSSNLANVTCLGIDATGTGTDMVRIGNVYVASIGGYQNWTNISDGRFKENVREDVPGLSFINQLRPVTYQLNRDQINEFTGVNARREKIRQENPGAEFLTGDKYSPVTTGFIAQEVEAAAKSIGYDFSGVDAPKNENDMYGLRYAEFVVPLVKAVQELSSQNEVQQKMNESQQIIIDELKAQNAALEERLAAIESKLSGK
jgi:trimeric autotransporter adhesin